jgi:hypothetical protein
MHISVLQNWVLCVLYIALWTVATLCMYFHYAAWWCQHAARARSFAGVHNFIITRGFAHLDCNLDSLLAFDAVALFTCSSYWCVMCVRRQLLVSRLDAGSVNFERCAPEWHPTPIHLHVSAPRKYDIVFSVQFGYANSLDVRACLKASACHRVFQLYYADQCRFWRGRMLCQVSV